VIGLSVRGGVLALLRRSLVLAGAGLWLALPAQAQSQQGQARQAQAQDQGAHMETSAGVSYLTGDYGQPGETTTVVYAPLTATLRAPNWRLEATVPLMRIHGPDNVAGADGTPVVVGSGSGRETTREGLGDVILGAGAYLPRAANLPLFDVSAKVKLPTADTNLGTGRADYSAQVAAYQPVTAKFLLMASAGYQWLGSSDLYRLRDGPTGMVGFNYKAASAVDAGATLNFTSRIAETLDHQIFVSPYLTWRVSKFVGITGYALAGLTRSSPTAGGGIQLTFYPAL
jgi:hypothetical protein